MENGITLSQVIAAIINFVILFLVLKSKFFKPVLKTINDRKEKIQSNIAKALQSKKEAEKLKDENKKLLIESKKQGKVIVEDYKVKAEKIYDEIVKEANKEADLIRKRAELDVTREKEKAQHEIKEQVIDLSMVLSEKVLENHIDEEEHRRLINDFIAKVGI
ncbi:F0F1 ATP synthase subunit B [Haloimpatiens sp. FM7330]|uniref:F0F1 ATP synthase subunit B n=1 Tax=Haloimpatiens sp. FM7330 TaxID=3298610 RepID=UPI00362E5D72